MSLRKSLNLLFMLMLVLAVACGGGKEVVDEAELGEDDQALQTAAAENTAEGGATATPAAATAAVANAVYHATGKRVRDLPITLDKLDRV